MNHFTHQSAKYLAWALCLYAGGALASSDPRTLAMGGAGIASSYGNAAIFSNPAQLMSRDYSFELGGNFALETENALDTKDKAEDFKDLTDTINSFVNGTNGKSKLNIKVTSQVPTDADLQNLLTNPTTASNLLTLDRYDPATKTAYYYPKVTIAEEHNQGPAFANTLNSASDKLVEIGNEPILTAEINLNGGIAYGCLGCLSAYALGAQSSVQMMAKIGVNNEDLSIIRDLSAVAANNEITVQDMRDLRTKGYITFSEKDLKTIDGSGTDAISVGLKSQIAEIVKNTDTRATGAEKLIVTNPVGEAKVVDSFEKKLKSKASMAVAAKAEVGFSYARELELDEWGVHRLHVGVTPKIVKVAVSEYTVRVDNANNIRKDDLSIQSKDGFSADVGVSYQVPKTQWNVGAVLRNIIPVSVESASGSKTAKLAPELAVGSAYRWHNVTFAADLDLLKYELIENGDRAKQFLSAGAEVDLAGWLALRAGVQHNLAKSAIGTRLTAGFGLFSNALQFSAYKGSNELGLQLAGSVQF